MKTTQLINRRNRGTKVHSPGRRQRDEKGKYLATRQFAENHISQRAENRDAIYLYFFKKKFFCTSSCDSADVFPSPFTVV